MRAIELLLNGRLASRPDFVEGVACTVGDRRKEAPRWAPPRTARRFYSAGVEAAAAAAAAAGGVRPEGSSDGNGGGDGDITVTVR